jgi:hypothetical protein
MRIDFEGIDNDDRMYVEEFELSRGPEHSDPAMNGRPVSARIK